MKKQNNILKKFNSTRGETLIEVLAAIIIVSLSSVIFLSMTASATKINMKSKEADEKFYHAMSNLEIFETDASGKVTREKAEITVTLQDSDKSEVFSVDVYSGNDMKAFTATASNASQRKEQLYVEKN